MGNRKKLKKIKNLQYRTKERKMKKLSSKKKILQIRMLNKNIQKIKLRKSKRVKDDKKATERERALPRNRQVQIYLLNNQL